MPYVLIFKFGDRQAQRGGQVFNLRFVDPNKSRAPRAATTAPRTLEPKASRVPRALFSAQRLLHAAPFPLRLPRQGLSSRVPLSGVPPFALPTPLQRRRIRAARRPPSHASPVTLPPPQRFTASAGLIKQSEARPPILFFPTSRRCRTHDQWRRTTTGSPRGPTGILNPNGVTQTEQPRAVIYSP